MNYGISKTSGEIVCKIDADDLIQRSFARELYNFFSKTKSDFVYPDIKKFIKFSTKFYLYYIQDLKTNSLLFLKSLK